MTVFHAIDTNVPLPQTMNNPFGYETHPACELAAQKVTSRMEIGDRPGKDVWGVGGEEREWGDGLFGSL